MSVKIDRLYSIEIFIVEIGGEFYRRISENNWEQLMGQAWEPVYNDKELEDAFVAYVRKGE